jgi:CheY-like chemotaxis protein
MAANPQFASAHPTAACVMLGKSLAKSVLIVDDNPSIRRMLCELFSSTEFHVCSEAQNGKEAVELTQALNPDLVVMDMSMPVMNGLQAASTLKKLMPSVAIILFSDYSEALSEQTARSAGFAARISKSQPVSDLIAAARQLCHTRAA